jgi:subtilisin family serine protease
MKKTIFILILIFFGISLYSQNKIKIEKADDLPKHYYNLEGHKAMDYINNRDLCIELADKLEKNLKSDLVKYDIPDKATMRGYYADFSTISFLKNDLKTAMHYIIEGRKLTEKDSDKFMWGLLDEVYFKTRIDNPDIPVDKFQAALKNNLNSVVSSLPFNVVQEDVEGMIGSFDIVSKNLLQGMVEGQLQPIIDKAQTQVPQFVVSQLLNTRLNYDIFLPYKDEVFKPVFQDFYDQNHVNVELVDIWKERDIELRNDENLYPVVIGIWDSGVDVAIFPENNRWINLKEKKDGKDSDQNGFVDDINGIAYDIEGNPVPDILFPIEELNSNYEQYEKYLKGFMDLQAMIKSKEADELKKHISSLAPADVNPFIENLGMYGNFSHGTHVAGIAAKGNPYAKILAARLTFPYENLPAPPTMEKSKRFAKLCEHTVGYFKENNVRVVNMSWGYSQNDYENLLAMNGIGEDAEVRKKMAIELFGIEKNALYEAMKKAPEILFVAAAGNANNDIDFANYIPGGLKLPNIMNVGAVDIEGKETGFTTTGKGVLVYSNGYEVESYIPGGEKRKYSGTSMAAPQVVNLAAKIWSKNPNLTVAELKDLIIKGATPSKVNPEILLIHPKQTLEMAKNN